MATSHSKEYDSPSRNRTGHARDNAISAVKLDSAAVSTRSTSRKVVHALRVRSSHRGWHNQCQQLAHIVQPADNVLALPVLKRPVELGGGVYTQ